MATDKSVLSQVIRVSGGEMAEQTDAIDANANDLRSGLVSRSVKRLVPNLWRAIYVAVEEEPDYLAASEFKNGYDPPANEDDIAQYEWIREYAEWMYEKNRDRYASLDAKAESLTKFFGTSAGLLFSGLVLAADRVGWICTLTWWLAAALAMVGIGIAALAKKPASSFLPPTIEEAIRYQEYYGENSRRSRASFLAQWHLASVGLRLASDRKATWVAHATNFAILALVVFGCAATFVAIPSTRNSGANVAEEQSPNPVQKPTGEEASLAPSTSGPVPPTQIDPQIIQNGSDAPRLIGPQDVSESADPLDYQRIVEELRDVVDPTRSIGPQRPE